MSSNCPPQLHLTLPANTTSFKRSFEQFGFDLEESPITSGVEPGGSSAGNRASGSAGNRNTRTGNERKRARSASSLSDGGESFRSSRSSSFTSSSDTSLSEDNVPTAEPSRSSSTRLVTALVDPYPPRLPTPDISDIQDIQMLDYEEGPGADTNLTSSTNEYSFTVEEFHGSDSEIEILQHSRSTSPHSRRSPTPPPTLPPLSLSEEEQPTDIPFLHSPTTASQSIDIDRPSLTSSASLSHRENRGLDAPPRLPSPVYDSSLTLSTAIPVSDIPLNIDNTDNANDVNETPMGQGRYVSFRERLNTAVGLLEADDVSSFRERLTSALDAVRTDERETDIESSNLPGSSRNTQQYNDRALQAPSGPSGSRPWRTLVLNNMRNGADETANLSPRTRDIFNSPSPSPDPTTLFNSESRMRPLYLASHSVLSQSRDSFSRSVSPSGLGDTSTGPLTGERQIRYNSTEHSSRASEPMATIRSHQHPSPQRSTGLAFPRRPPSQSIEQLSSASVSAPFNRELARWFEVPADTTLPEHPPSSSVAAAARSVTPLPLSDIDDEWINLGSRAQSRVERLREAIPGRGFAFPRTNRYLDRGEDDDQDQEDEDIIAGLLSSTYERANHASTTSATRINTSSRSTRVPPSLASLMARDHLFSDQDDDQDDDNVTVRASDSTEASRTERYRDSSAPRRYTDVLSIADYRSQLLADAQRRRYIEQGSVNPRESLESWTSSNQEHRRSTTNNASNFDQDERSSAGYRLTAHTEDERSSLASVRWQFSWNDALGLDQSELRQDEARAFQRERGRLDGRSQIPTNVPRSSLFGRSMRDEDPLSNNAQNIDESSGVSRWEQRRNEQNINGDLAYQRLRSRVFGSTRSSASNSLVAENAAEIRRRNARADLMEHLFHDDTSRPSNRPLNRDHARNTDSWRSSVIGHRESFPSQRSIPYQRRSPSPSDFPRSIADVLDATDQELEEQERRTREEGADVLPRRSNSLSWLPPPQFGFDQSLSETLVGFSSDLNTANSSEGGRLPEIDWLRRRSLAMSRFRHSDDSRAQTHSTPTEFERSNHVTPFPRSRAPSSSSRVAPSSESSGFFDSRHSSITDIARTINDRSNLLSSRAQLLNDSDLETSPRTVPNDANLRRPLRTYSPRIDAELRNNSAPFIPPPDLGSLFSPNDLSTSSFHSSVSMDIDQESPPARSHQRHAPTQSDPSHIVPSSTARTQYPSINVDSFAPGPFRSTMQRLAAQNNSRNVSQEAPTIPPLSFGEDLESFSEARSYIGAENQENTIGYNLEEPRDSNPSLIRESRMPSFERAPWPSQTPSSVRSRTREPSRTGDDIHGAITRRARMEGSLIEGSIPLSRTLSSTPLGDESFQHAIEVLRQDGLSELRSHQLINRYRQRRDAFPTATSWGDIESDNTQNLSYRYAPWSMHGDVSTSNPAASASSTTSNTTARMGNAATRRRPSPARNLDRPDGSQDSRANRPRISSRFGRHRTSELDRDFATLSDLVGRSRRARGNFNLGDYMRDEDFDQSYEGLMSLAATLGEVKPRATPDHVVAGLKTGFYKDWASDECDKRCPICLDDYKALDPVLKLNDCSHWLHKSCLEQWLKGASTCPVCRKSVQTSAPHRHPRLRSHMQASAVNALVVPSGLNRTDQAIADSEGNASAVSNRVGNANTVSYTSDLGSEFSTTENSNNPDTFRHIGQRPRRFYWEYSPPSP